MVSSEKTINAACYRSAELEVVILKSRSLGIGLLIKDKGSEDRSVPFLAPDPPPGGRWVKDALCRFIGPPCPQTLFLRLLSHLFCLDLFLVKFLNIYLPHWKAFNFSMIFSKYLPRALSEARWKESRWVIIFTHTSHR